MLCITLSRNGFGLHVDRMLYVFSSCLIVNSGLMRIFGKHGSRTSCTNSSWHPDTPATTVGCVHYTVIPCRCPRQGLIHSLLHARTGCGCRLSFSCCCFTTDYADCPACVQPVLTATGFVTVKRCLRNLDPIQNRHLSSQQSSKNLSLVITSACPTAVQNLVQIHLRLLPQMGEILPIFKYLLWVYSPTGQIV